MTFSFGGCEKKKLERGDGFSCYKWSYITPCNPTLLITGKRHTLKATIQILGRRISTYFFLDQNISNFRNIIGNISKKGGVRVNIPWLVSLPKTSLFIATVSRKIWLTVLVVMFFKILSVTSPISSISISRNIARVINMISMVHSFTIFYKFSSLPIYLGPCLNIVTVDFWSFALTPSSALKHCNSGFFGLSP